MTQINSWKKGLFLLTVSYHHPPMKEGRAGEKEAGAEAEAIWDCCLLTRSIMDHLVCFLIVPRYQLHCPTNTHINQSSINKMQRGFATVHSGISIFSNGNPSSKITLALSGWNKTSHHNSPTLTHSNLLPLIIMCGCSLSTLSCIILYCTILSVGYVFWH